MTILITIYLFITGLVLGSFFNVVGLRVPVGESIVAPRSACPHCKHTLTARELIPVVSYAMQGGKCLICQAPISPLYPIMELVTGVLFAITPLFTGWEPRMIIGFALVSLMVIITVSDLAYMLIPNKVLLFFTGIFLFLLFFIDEMEWLDSLFGSAAGFLLLLSIAVLSKGGMGGGDIKLFAVIGLALGVRLTLLALFFSVLYGAVIGYSLILFKFAERRQPVPFGPFIAIGTLTSYFFGEAFIHWYFGILY